MKKWLTIILCVIISIGCVLGINYYASSKNTDDVVCFRLKKDVKTGDPILSSDVYEDYVSKGIYSDLANVEDLKGKTYSTNMYKDDILRKISAVSSSGADNIKIGSNEGFFGIKTDLYNSAGATIIKGDYVTVVGIKKALDPNSSNTVDVFSGKFQVVSVKTDKAMSLEEAERLKASNTLIVPIPAVVTVKLNVGDIAKFAQYDEFKLIKR